jgi:protein-S-isoprenylcysteine O-methyltransferase Ste14
VRFFRYFALVIFFFDLPVPLYWFVLHPFNNFWRARIRAAFWIAGLGAWTTGALFIAIFRNRWLAPGSPSILSVVVAITFVAADFLLLSRAGKDLGNMALVGHSELTGKMKLTTIGIYKYVRHPRYAGMILSMLGGCLLAATRWSWIVAGFWLPCVLACILLEERELRHRFGPAYDDYSRSVPRFLPRLWNP